MSKAPDRFLGHAIMRRKDRASDGFSVCVFCRVASAIFSVLSFSGILLCCLCVKVGNTEGKKAT